MTVLEKNGQPDIAFSYAPGKVILVGEHAVVYGAQAIALPILEGIRVAVFKKRSESNLEGPILRGMGPFFMGDISLTKTSKGPQLLKNALRYLVEALGDEIKNITLIVDGTLPPGRGLGSSASLSVALIKGIFRYFSWPLSKEILNKHALALETIFHGSPSGIDHSVVIDEQVIGFRRNNSEALVWPISIKSPLKLVVGIVGPHDGTKNAVKELAERKVRHESIYQRIFLSLNDIAKEMENSLINGELASVGELMNIAQGYLNALSLSTPQIEKLCAIARERGALGAKLTGAGGGGAVIALVDGNETDIQNAFKAAGYHNFITEVVQKPATKFESNNVILGQ